MYSDVITLSEFSLHPLMHTIVSNKIPHNMIYGDLKCERFIPYPLKNTLTICQSPCSNSQGNISNVKRVRTFIKNIFPSNSFGWFCWGVGPNLFLYALYNLYTILFKVVKLMYLFSAYAVIILINCGQFEAKKHSYVRSSHSRIFHQEIWVAKSEWR